MLEFDVGDSVAADGPVGKYAGNDTLRRWADRTLRPRSTTSGKTVPCMAAVAFRHGHNLGQINDKKIEVTEKHTTLLAKGETGRPGSSEGFMDSVGVHVRHQKEADAETFVRRVARESAREP